MGNSTGIAVLGDYTTPATPGKKIDALLALIPNPDQPWSSSGVQAGGGLLDEMSSPAAVQIRVELAALKGALDAGGDDVAYGQYTVTGADATANLVNIVTGLADTSLSNIGVSVSRAGSLVTADAVITEPTPGTIRVADGSTYNTTAGDIINWFARDPSA